MASVSLYHLRAAQSCLILGSSSETGLTQGCAPLPANLGGILPSVRGGSSPSFFPNARIHSGPAHDSFSSNHKRRVFKEETERATLLQGPPFDAAHLLRTQYMALPAQDPRLVLPSWKRCTRFHLCSGDWARGKVLKHFQRLVQVRPAGTLFMLWCPFAKAWHAARD